MTITSNTHCVLIVAAGGIPNDGIAIEEVVTVSLSLTVVYVILATAGIVFAVLCLSFNLLYKQKK